MRKGIVKKHFRHPKLSPEMIDQRVWYALRVESQKEFVTQRILQILGLMSYVPVRREWRHKNKFDKSTNKPKTLFSFPETVGYVFVGFAPNQLVTGNIPHWLKLFKVFTIKAAIGVAGRPLQVDPESLKRLAKQYPNGLQRPNREQYMRTYKEFKEGDDVRICSGPFEGHVVPVKEIKEGHATLPVKFLGVEREIIMPTFDLEKDDP